MVGAPRFELGTSCVQGRRVGRTIICSRHSFDQNLLNSLDSARRRPLMIKLNSRLLTEGLAGASASQIADFLRVRDAYFGALLAHSSLQIGSFSATDSVPGHSKQMKRGEYEQGR